MSRVALAPRQLRRSFASFLYAYATLSAAFLTLNRTIDDEFGDSATGKKPVYLPDGAWTQGSQCSGCHIRSTSRGGQVEVNNVFDQTWHDTTSPGDPQNHNMSVSFNGTAVYVYNILANSVPKTTTLTNLTFLVDGQIRGNFSHTPDPASPTIMYHALVFSETGLSNEEHTLVMMTSGSQHSLVLFDEVVYTTNASDSGTGDSGTVEMMNTSSLSASFPASSTSTGIPPAPMSTNTASSNAASSNDDHSKSAVAIGSAVGAGVGVVVAIITLATAIFFLRKRGIISLNPAFRSTRRNARDIIPISETSTNTSSSFTPILPSSPISRTPSPAPSPIDTRHDAIGTYPKNSRAHRETLLPVSPVTTIPNSHIAWDRALLVRPTHRPDVPAPALTATGTEHSTRITDLTEQIRALEETMRDIRGEKKGKSQESLPRDGSASMTMLKERVRRLRQQLENERRLMAEAFPRDDKW